MEETQNVCAMPEIATIELHRSEETGNYYLNYITWFDGDDRCVSAHWRTSTPLSCEAVEMLRQFCQHVEMDDETLEDVRAHGDMSGACYDCKQCKFPMKKKGE